MATDVLGVSGRLILNGLIEGEQDATKLADLAVGVLRKKRNQLTQALNGKVDDHHRANAAQTAAGTEGTRS